MKDNRKRLFSRGNYTMLRRVGYFENVNDIKHDEEQVIKHMFTKREELYDENVIYSEGLGTFIASLGQKAKDVALKLKDAATTGLSNAVSKQFKNYKSAKNIFLGIQQAINELTIMGRTRKLDDAAVGALLADQLFRDTITQQLFEKYKDANAVIPVDQIKKDAIAAGLVLMGSPEGKQLMDAATTDSAAATDTAATEKTAAVATSTAKTKAPRLASSLAAIEKFIESKDVNADMIGYLTGKMLAGNKDKISKVLGIDANDLTNNTTIFVIKHRK